MLSVRLAGFRLCEAEHRFEGRDRVMAEAEITVSRNGQPLARFRYNLLRGPRGAVRFSTIILEASPPLEVSLGSEIWELAHKAMLNRCLAEGLLPLDDEELEALDRGRRFLEGLSL